VVETLPWPPGFATVPVSVLYREPMWLKLQMRSPHGSYAIVSVLYREPMWLKLSDAYSTASLAAVSVLYREPMWLKRAAPTARSSGIVMFQCSTVSRCG